MPRQNFAGDRIVVPKVSVWIFCFDSSFFYRHPESEYGEEGDKQISLYKGEGEERNKYAHAKRATSSLPNP
jgi:hypothetical protein